MKAARFLLFLSFFLLVLPVLAQVDTARIIGTVRDASGAVVPGAEVSITHLQTGRQYAALVTGSDGVYKSVPLAVGDFRVEAKMQGFKRAVREGITLEIQQTAVIDFALEVGGVTDVVNVVEAAPLLATTEATQGQVVDNKRILELPLNGRDYLELALLSEGTTESVGGAMGGFSSGGLRTSQNNFMIDGIDNNNMQMAAAARRGEAMKPSIDGIQEFKVLTNSYTAEYGRAAGAVVNMTLKSGTNSLHGTAFEFVRNEKLDAKNFFDSPTAVKPPFKRNQFGFSLGGPIIKNRTFFFGDYEGFLRRESGTTLATVPTLKMRSGDFSEFTKTIYDPATYNGTTRTAFPGRLIPDARIDPIARKVVALYPTPTGSGTTRNFLFNPPNQENNHRFDIKIDRTFGANDNVYFRYSYQYNFLPSSPALPAPAWGGAGETFETDGQNTGLVWNHIFSPRLVTSNRFGWNNVQTSRLAPITENVNATLGLKGVDQTTPGEFATFAPQGYSMVGLSAFNPNFQNAQNRQFKSDTTHMSGRHSLKFGADILRVQINFLNIRQDAGRFTFTAKFTNNVSPGAGGDSMADLLLGLPSTSDNATPVRLNGRAWIDAFYVQDEWRVTRKLTLNVGARYELVLPFVDKYDRMANFDMDADPGHPVLVVAKRGGNRYERALVHTDANNLAPRFGFAYQALRNTVLRGGYGIFYSVYEPAGDSGFLVANPPFAFTVSVTAGVTPYITLKDGFPPQLFTVEHSERIRFSSFETKGTLADAQQWNFNIEHQFAKRWMFQIGYYGTKGTHVFRPIDRNYSPAGPGDDLDMKRVYKSLVIPGTGGQPFVTTPLGSLNRKEGSGNSIYHAMEMKVEKRYSGGFSLLGSWRWSKAIGDTCGFGASGLSGALCGIQDVTNLRLERGLDNQHMAHRAVISPIWELPFGKGRRLGAGWGGWRDALLGGWAASAIITLRTGRPVNVVAQNDSANTGAVNRPNLVGQPQLPRDQRTLQRYFNTDAFQRNAQYRFGSAGVNLLIGPSFNNVDYGLSKVFRFSERVKMQFRAEAFNGFNTPHFGLPATQLGANTFGQINGAGAPRKVQFGAKVLF